MPWIIERQDKPGAWHQPSAVEFASETDAEKAVAEIFATGPLNWKRSEFRVREIEAMK